jgi:hypothetical protein
VYSKLAMAIGLEFYVDQFCFGSNLLVGCVALKVSFPKYPRSLNSEFEDKSYSRFSVERSVTELCDLRVWSVPASPVREQPDTRGVWLVMT